MTTGFPATELLLSFILSAFVSSVVSVDVVGGNNLGICYGEMGDSLPTPSKSVELLKAMNVKLVKIYDANPDILGALKGSDIEVSVMVPNQLLVSISASESVADEWIRSQVLPFYPNTKIRYIVVGNEVLSFSDTQTQQSLVPSMQRIQNSLAKVGLLGQISVTTTLAMDVLEASYPPSNGTFRADMSAQIIKPMLQFLVDTKSFLFLDVYTYFPWASNPVDIKLEYALLSASNISVTDPGTGLTYTNLLDQMIDSVYFAMKRMGYPQLPIVIAETGWPNGGDAGQTGATVDNAATYNQNVIKKFTATPPAGTPALPGVVMPAFIFALYNENSKPGLGSERHFGLLNPDGSKVYALDFPGAESGAPAPGTPAPPVTPSPGTQVAWCVAKNGADPAALESAVTYACSQGTGTCDPTKPQGVCYRPDSPILQASYAFSAYWAQFNQQGGTCDFGGVAQQTTQNPSFGSCKFPSVALGTPALPAPVTPVPPVTPVTPAPVTPVPPVTPVTPVPPVTPSPGTQVAWCVAKNGADPAALESAVTYACSQGTGTCDPTKPQGVCYRPDSPILQASYAFSAYWAQFKQQGATCDFGGVAQQTTQDPSFGSCKFPSVAL